MRGAGYRKHVGAKEGLQMARFITRCLTMAFAALAALIVLMASSNAGDNKYDVGASDTTIKVGNIMPYSGPASAYGAIGRAMTAYFKMVNDRGGINGRKIEFLSYDDAYSPPQTVQQARKLLDNAETALVTGCFV